MLNVTCNIETNERVSRLIIGVILLLGGIIGLGRGFVLLMGIILAVEAFIGWCAIPLFADKLKLDSLFKKSDKSDNNPPPPQG